MIDTSDIGSRLRTVLELSRGEAVRLRHHYISTEHLLLGLLDEGQGVAITVLTNLGVDLTKLRSQTESLIEPGAPENADIPARPFTARAARALRFAREEARMFGHQYLATEHLLLGLAFDPASVSGKVLAAGGVEVDAARAEIRRVLGM